MSFSEARQYDELFAPVITCMLTSKYVSCGFDGHIISIQAHATPAPHTSATTRALRSADARRGVQADRTAGRQPDDVGGNRRLVGLQPRTRQPSIRIER